jgi:hypothetical protein
MQKVGQVNKKGSKMYKLVTLVFMTIVFACVTYTAYGQSCKEHTYRGYIGWTGPSDNIYINTNVWGCIAREKDQCDSKGGYLYLKNLDSKKVYRWSGAGNNTGGVGTTLKPGESTLYPLSIYLRRGEDTPRQEITLTVCE